MRPRGSKPPKNPLLVLSSFQWTSFESAHFRSQFDLHLIGFSWIAPSAEGDQSELSHFVEISRKKTAPTQETHLHIQDLFPLCKGPRDSSEL